MYYMIARFIEIPYNILFRIALAFHEVLYIYINFSKIYSWIFEESYWDLMDFIRLFSALVG